MRWREIDDFFQALFFIGLKISNSLVVLLELLHQPDGVFDRYTLPDRQLKDFAQRRQFTIDRRFAALRSAFADSIATNVFILFNKQGRDFGKGSFAEEFAEGFDEVLVILVRKLVFDLDVVLSFPIIAPSPFQGLLIESVNLVTQREPLFHISRNIVTYCADYS